MLNDTQPYIIVMDTLLKETVDLTVNSRYPGMAPEGRRQIEEVLIRKEVEKGEILLKEGQISHNLVFVGKGMLRQFYYKNGKDVTEHFSYEGCIIMWSIQWYKKLKYLLARKTETVTEKYPLISNGMVAAFLVAVCRSMFSEPVPEALRLSCTVFGWLVMP